MTVTINGTSGPYNLSSPGGYGGNTAYNVQNASPEEVRRANIQIAPTLQEVPQNAVGYAREDIKPFDTTKDGRLDLNELAQVYGGNETMAGKFLKAYDVNGDGAIDVKENAASVVFSLAPTHLLNKTLEAFGNSNGILSAKQKQELSEGRKFLSEGSLSEAPKVYSTQQDRAMAEFYAMKFPNFTRETLGGIISGLKLDQMA